MKAKQRTLAAILLLILLLGGLLWLVQRQSAQELAASSAAADGTIVLSSFAVGDLETIQYTYQGETLTLNYHTGDWTLEEDPAYHLDSTACNTMATALSTLNAKRSLTAQSGEDYGLTDPAVKVTVTAAGETSTFLFGAQNPITGDLYLQKEGETEIYTVSGNKATCFELSKQELFGRFNPAGLTASALEKVSITTSDGTFALSAISKPAESADDDAASSAADSDAVDYETVWRLDGEPDAELNGTTVQSLLSALAGVVSGQVTAADPDDYGFAAPLITVDAETADGAATLYYATNAEGCWMMKKGDDSVYSVDLDTVTALLLTEDALKTES